MFFCSYGCICKLHSLEVTCPTSVTSKPLNCKNDQKLFFGHVTTQCLSSSCFWVNHPLSSSLVLLFLFPEAIRAGL